MIHMHIIGGIVPLIPAILRRRKTFAQNLRKHLAPERHLHPVRIKLLIFKHIISGRSVERGSKRHDTVNFDL